MTGTTAGKAVRAFNHKLGAYEGRQQKGGKIAKCKRVYGNVFFGFPCLELQTELDKLCTAGTKRHKMQRVSVQGIARGMKDCVRSDDNVEQ